MRTEYLKHNGIDIENYPADDWLFAPFPREKMPIYCNDNLATVNRTYFTQEPIFNHCLESARTAWGNSVKRDISWRLHIFLQAAKLAFKQFERRNIFVELGTGKGYMIRALAASEIGKNLESFCFDSYTANLPTKIDPDEIDPASRFAYASGEKDLEELKFHVESVSDPGLARKFNFIKGVLPGSLIPFQENDIKINFLHVDLNHAESELMSLNLLKEFLDENSVLLFDDTGAPGSEDQKDVHEKFINSINKIGFYLPTGQLLAI